ncbi:MAG: chemotaxis-specific protein-glutamate methyltransferase CheB [Candidatus Eremiobacteraeota bacterium]|nr:chemotaxis-specific protein-glutamate methyltransferase CheB [Candidatus Eremiobacteraeota bacterium]
MRIAIVNDMNMALEVLRRVVLSQAGYQIAWTAGNGQEALEKCREDTPDLILMDLVMPVLNGVEATRRIMAECPCSILIVTASVDHKAAMVFEALGAGALDAVKTPGALKLGEAMLVEPILKKMATVSKLIATTPERSPNLRGLPLVALGASSGGPQALSRILSSLPSHFAAPVVLIQHIDGEFLQGLVDWLAGQTALPVRLAREGDRPRAGQVLVAGSQGHLVGCRDGTLHYSRRPSPRVNCPSIDVFFESLAQDWPNPVVAALLTGMGADGAEGLLALRRAGQHTIAQNQESCVIFGMPQVAIRLGAACEVLALERIAGHLSQRIKQECLR